MAKWAVGTLDKWLLAHFAVRVIARKGQMAVGTLDKWLLGHLAFRKISRRAVRAWYKWLLVHS